MDKFRSKFDHLAISKATSPELVLNKKNFDKKLKIFYVTPSPKAINFTKLL